MFLAELAYNTVAREIDELENKKDRRKKTLETSQKELEEDHMDLIKFINDDTKHKNEREEEEKRQQKLKAEKEEKLKGIEQQIDIIKSEIDKNKDGLGGLEKAREFIL
jgi:hypothetical protein